MRRGKLTDDDYAIVATLVKRIVWREGSANDRLRATEKRAKQRTKAKYADPALEKDLLRLVRGVQRALRDGAGLTSRTFVSSDWEMTARQEADWGEEARAEACRLRSLLKRAHGALLTAGMFDTSIVEDLDRELGRDRTLDVPCEHPDELEINDGLGI